MKELLIDIVNEVPRCPGRKGNHAPVVKHKTGTPPEVGVVDNSDEKP